MRKLNVIFISIICFLFVGITVFTLVSDKQSFSVYENRSLADAPSLSVKTVFDASFFEQSETYLKDHIAFRDTLLTGYTAFNKYLLRKPVVNDIIDTKTSLLPYIEPKYADHAPTSDIEREADAVCDISKLCDGFLFLGIPSQASRFADEYPDYLSDIPQYNLKTEEVFEKALGDRDVDYLDCKEILSKDMYFKTDHHFNINGGYEVYKKMCEYADVAPVDISRFTFKETYSEIYGSRNRKIYKLSDLSDKISYYVLDADIPFERYDNGKKVDSRVFDLNADIPSYGIYMGGDVGNTVIKTGREELPNILIYGDSYTNAVECFAYLSFNETHSIDFRDYTEKSLSEYIKANDIDYVFCIRNDASFGTLDPNGDIK